MIQLSDICSLITDGSHFSPKDEETGYPMLSVKDMRDTDFDFSDCKHISSEAYQKLVSTGCRPQVGDVVVAKDGSYLKSAFPITQDRDIVLLSSIAILRPDTTLVLPTYLSYYLKSPSVFRTVSLNYITGTALKRIILAGIRKLPIELPGIEEQQKRVKLLDIAYQIIQIRQRQLLALDTLIKARFIEMFGAITETVPLSFYIESLTAGKSLAGEEECQNKVLKTGAATYDYFDPSQVKNLPTGYEPLPEHQIHNGDVIISRMNTTELVGAAAYVWQAPERTYLPDRLWKAELTDRADPIFVWQAIVQPKTKEAIRRIAGGTSGSMKNISKPGLLSLHVKKVELEQQKQFAAFVAHVDKSKVVVQKALDKAQLLFDGLMQQYFG